MGLHAARAPRLPELAGASLARTAGPLLGLNTRLLLLPCTGLLPQGRLQMELASLLGYGAAERSLALMWRLGLLDMLLPQHALHLRVRCAALNCAVLWCWAGDRQVRCAPRLLPLLKLPPRRCLPARSGTACRARRGRRRRCAASAVACCSSCWLSWMRTCTRRRASPGLHGLAGRAGRESRPGSRGRACP